VAIWDINVSDVRSRIGAGPVYVSLEADIGGGENAGAVRFLDTIGLELVEVVEIGKALRSAFDGAGAELVGMDIMEIDAHFADIPGSGDHTPEMCVAFALEMVGK
jgi:arginase family enzyme